MLPLLRRRSPSGGGGDRRLHREIPRAGKAFEQLPAFRRVVLIERRHLQVFDVEGNAVSERHHQDDGAKDGEGEPDRIAQQLNGFATRIGPEAGQIEPPRRTYRFRLDRRRCGRRRFDLLRAVDPRRVGEIADERVLQRIAAALLDQFERRADRQHLARMHQRDAVATLRLVHEVGRKKDRHAVVAGEIDQRAPKRIARDRIDAGSRLVEDENGGLMQHRDRELKPLLDAERQALGLGVDDSFQIVALQKLLDAAFDLVGRQMVKLRVQIEILPHGKFAVEREGLRHVADVAAHLHVVRSHRAPKQLRPALGRGQEPGQHLHRGRFAATVGAEEAEDFAARDLEVDVIDGDEVAELPRQSLGLDRRHFVRRSHARADDHFLMQRALFLRQQCDKRLVERGFSRLLQQLLQLAMGDDLAVVHRHQPIEALRFVHVGRGDDDAHLRASRPDRIDEVPELTPRKRIDAGRRLVEDEQVRIVDERTAKAELLLHAAGELAGRPVLERVECRRGQKLGDAGASLGRRLSEQPAEEIDVLEYAQRRIEIAAQPLRHVGDAAADGFEMGGVAQDCRRRRRPVPSESAHARNKRQQRGLADPVRPDHAHHDPRGNVDRDVIERDRRAVTVRDVRDAGDDGVGHCGSLT